MDVEPIGAEPVELSVELARLDAGLRRIDVMEALAARAGAYRSSRPLTALWDSDDVELLIELDGGWQPAISVARSTGVTWVLLTAMNPMAEELTADVNAERNRLMAAELGSPLRSVGRSSEGSWEESGFAVPVSRAAFDVAQHFAQAAVYLVSPDAVTTVFLVGTDPRALDRLAVQSNRPDRSSPHRTRLR